MLASTLKQNSCAHSRSVRSPNLGALGAGATIVCFAAAIDPGWHLALSCAAVFCALELVVANLVEPQMYGHSAPAPSCAAPASPAIATAKASP